MAKAGYWTKELALAQLDTFREQADALHGSEPMSEEHTRWLLRTLTFLKDVFGEASAYFGSFRALPWAFTGERLIIGPEAFNPDYAVARLNREAVMRSLRSAKGILAAARDELERRDIKDIYEAKDTGPEASLIVKVVSLVERKLRKVIRYAPANEKEVQDKFEDLLVGADVPFSREQERITYSSKTYTPDFTVDRADLAIELKFCARRDREKEIIAEINDDIMAYKQRYGNIIFVIYDTGQIRDVDRFTEQFETDGILVRIVKH